VANSLAKQVAEVLYFKAFNSGAMIENIQTRRAVDLAQQLRHDRVLPRRRTRPSRGCGRLSASRRRT
jgi:hypothetical protein